MEHSKRWSVSVDGETVSFIDRSHVVNSLTGEQQRDQKVWINTPE